MNVVKTLNLRVVAGRVAVAAYQLDRAAASAASSS
jgi:hypothetical protein